MREKLKDDLEARYDQLITLLDDGLKATRQVRVARSCLKCGCKHIEFVEVQDFKTAREIAEFFANQGFGRPGQAEAESEQSFVFTNNVTLVPED